MKYKYIPKSFKFIYIALALLVFAANTVYANSLQKNQCAKLFADKTPSFAAFINAGVRQQQEAQKQNAEVQEAELKQRAIDEKRQKQEANDPLIIARKIRFIPIKPRKFQMIEGQHIADVEITKPYEIMDTKMTQMMYAQLMLLMGYDQFEYISPSWFCTGPNCISKTVGEGTTIIIRLDDPVTNVSWSHLTYKFIVKLNQLSKSEDPIVQQNLKKFILDHREGDVYALLTDAQLVNAMQLAKTTDGDSIDAMIKRGDHKKLKEYVHYAETSDEDIGTIPEASLRPLFIDSQPIYLHGNVWEWVEDYWDGKSPLISGQDPVSYPPPSSNIRARVLRGGSYENVISGLSSHIRSFFNYSDGLESVGFRLARISRISIDQNNGGTK